MNDEHPIAGRDIQYRAPDNPLITFYQHKHNLLRIQTIPCELSYNKTGLNQSCYLCIGGQY